MINLKFILFSFLYLFSFIINIYCLFTIPQRTFQFTKIEIYVTASISLLFFVIGFISFLMKNRSIVSKRFFYLTTFFGIVISNSLPSSFNLGFSREIEIVSLFFLSYFLINFFSTFPVSTKPMYVKILNLIALIHTIIIIVFFLGFFLFSNLTNNHIVKLFKPLLILNLVLGLTYCVFLIFLHLKSNSKKVKNQLLLLIFGIIISSAPILFLNIIPGVLFGLSPIPFIYCLPFVVIFPLTTIFILIKQDVLDFQLNNYKWLKYILLNFLIVLIINITLHTFISLSKTETLILDSVSLISSLLSIFLYMLMEILFNFQWKRKTKKIRIENIEISQKFLNEKNMYNYAKMIGELFHQIVNITGVCIIWDQNNINNCLYETGIFLNIEKFSLFKEVMKKILDSSYDKTPIEIIFNEEQIISFPLTNKNITAGTIIIGKKSNYPMSEREMLLIEEIVNNFNEFLTTSELIQSNEVLLQKMKLGEKISGNFNNKLIQSIEEEKKKLSVFLHDDILQMLILQLNELRMVQAKQELSYETLNVMDEQLETMISDIREMCHELHPMIVEDLGLEASLKSLKRKIEFNYSVLMHLKYECSLKIISKGYEIQFYRIIKELAINAIKHSKGKNIYLHIFDDNHQYFINVQDDGIGFVPPNKSIISSNTHFGLATIQRQITCLNGNMNISSKANVGTLITITVPIYLEEKNEYTHVIGR